MTGTNINNSVYLERRGTNSLPTCSDELDVPLAFLLELEALYLLIRFRGVDDPSNIWSASTS